MRELIKKGLKAILPPILIRVYSLARHRWMHFDFSTGSVTWRGIYNAPSSVPRRGGFNENKWIDILTRESQETNGCLASHPYPGAVVKEEHMLLPFLLSLLKQDKVSVLDFGGGIGLSYLFLKASLRKQITLDYHILETPGVCRFGIQYHSQNKNIRFHSDISEISDKIDVFYTRTSIQYVEDFGSFLGRVASLRPKYLLYTHLCAGDVPTFFTAQVNLPGASIPYAFHNIEEFIRLHKEAGYQHVFTGGSEFHHSMQNLPEGHRLNEAMNVLFEDTSSNSG